MTTPTPTGSYGGAGSSNNPPPPPLSMAGGPPQQGPSVLQILAMGQERNHAADAMAQHPRIESLIKLGKEAEATWLQIGQTAEAVADYDRAIAAYESALRHNAYSVVALSQIAAIFRSREEFKKAAEYFGRVVSIAPESGDVWGALGHCFLMIDDLKKAYSSYQQALYYMPNPHEPKLWYGIGILYDRYGSLEHAEEAFSSVIRMEPNFEKANEIFFRLGIIYKQQRKSAQSLECFRYILNNPPRPLTEIDIWFQIGHVYEQQKDFIAAKESYERVLQENPAHAKVLQQLGGLYHRSQAPFYDPEMSVQILTKSLESDPNDPFSWYLLGRAYMTTSNFGKAYEAYQQAVYRDGKNPAFWCSIGVLYYNINQFHDALDAYSRAIRIHPYLAEVWYNLGALYEACNDQMTDAIDAYQRTLQLDPTNTTVTQRLSEIREHQTSGAALSPPPAPKDISPSSMSWSYATNSGGAPTQLAQAGLGPELSPSMGPQPPAPNGPPARVPTSGSGASPHASAGRFEAMPMNGGRPRSTDPYRRSAIQHSPSYSGGGPADRSPRYATPTAPGHRLPPYKDGRAPPNGRLGSPPSPRSRPPDGTAGQPGSYPFPAHLANGSHSRESVGSSDGPEWERSRTGGPRNGPSSTLPPRGVLHPPTHPHPYSSAPAHGPQHQHQHSQAYSGRSPNMQPPAVPAASPYERAGPAIGARPPFLDNPSPGPYGAYPPASSAAAAVAEEYARRRSSGSTNGSQRSGHPETKPTIPSLDAAMNGISASGPAPTPPTKGRGSRKKPEGGADGPKKAPRRGKGSAATAAASADSADGSAASTNGTTTPKKRRAKAAPKARKESMSTEQQDKESEEAAQAAATLTRGSPTQPRAQNAVLPQEEPAAQQRQVDEEYDEGVDALMSLGGGARSEASPPAARPAANEPAPDASTPRKRSLPVDAAPEGESIERDGPTEPDAKRARPDPAVPQPEEASMPPASAAPTGEAEGVLGPARTETANLSGDAAEEIQARRDAEEPKAEAAPPAADSEPLPSPAPADTAQASTTTTASSAGEDKENVGESAASEGAKQPVDAAREEGAVVTAAEETATIQADAAPSSAA